jgi:hypothetical protein
MRKLFIVGIQRCGACAPHWPRKLTLATAHDKEASLPRRLEWAPGPDRAVVCSGDSGCTHGGLFTSFRTFPRWRSRSSRRDAALADGLWGRR